jgi:hypothetical protein
MFTNFQLAAIVRTGQRTHLLRIPMHQDLQNTLMQSWHQQYQAFIGGIEEVDFDPGYNPEDHERFRLSNFELPAWLAGEDSTTVPQLDPVNQLEDQLESIRAFAAFVRLDSNELILFQNFTRSHVIRPGNFLFLRNETYETPNRPGLTLDSKLAAVHYPQDEKILFRSFRIANTFLPLNVFYREASEIEIREILDHNLLAPADMDAIVAYGQMQWFRKRFAMLRDSGILDEYTAQEILNHSENYDVAIEIDEGKIVFPTEKPAAKRLLQFLNEELFRGAITETLYETNSKREAD